MKRTSITPNLPVIREVDAAQQIQQMKTWVTMGVIQPGTRLFKMGKVKILLSPPTTVSGWHLSISHPERYPTWDEVAKAWYELVPQAEQQRLGAMMLPPMSEYINLHEFCFQIHEVATVEA